MNMIYKLSKRYLFFFIMIVITISIFLIDKNIGFKTLASAKSSFLQMLGVLPPIMLILGLMDVWIPREILMRYMGDNSGFLGILLSILIGSLAAGPMYAAFPFTAVLMKKGVKFSNIIIFMNAWCVTKISTLLFEFSSLGVKFTLVRLAINIPGIIIMGLIIQYLMNKQDLNEIYNNSKNL